MQNEIDRLQSLVQEHEEYIANLELEAASTDNKIDGLAVLLGITPDTGNRRIIGIIKDEILRLQAKAVRLEREAEWLAARCHEFCDFNNYCNECALYPGNTNFPHPDCGVKLVDEERARARFMKHTVDWREAARKATENPA